jgi:site-specific DNA-methyltransferase (adenine-specific)
MGSGSTAIAALKSERKYIGYDIDSEYIKIAENRIAPNKLQMSLGLKE